jgi:hypothetical protein
LYSNVIWNNVSQDEDEANLTNSDFQSGFLITKVNLTKLFS